VSWNACTESSRGLCFMCHRLCCFVIHAFLPYLAGFCLSVIWWHSVFLFPLLQQSVVTQRNIRINIFSVPCPSIWAVFVFVFVPPPQIKLVGQHFTPLLQVCSERQTSMLNYNGPKFIMTMCCIVKLQPHKKEKQLKAYDNYIFV
jgi:hypothetical protein